MAHPETSTMLFSHFRARSRSSLAIQWGRGASFLHFSDRYGKAGCSRGKGTIGPTRRCPRGGIVRRGWEERE
ncbi:MAG: hypothetical protein DRH20_01030 [Deltaproteobacteria bacterium]|nr:MAG: hypothetical protein DRH20_01030 [Deltaproteobacteria bacterium]